MAHDENSVIEIVHVQRLGGQAVLNVMHWTLAPGIVGLKPITGLISLVEELDRRWGEFAARLHVDWSLIGTTGRVVLTSANVNPVDGTGTLVYGDQYEFIRPGPTIGVQGGDRLPTYAAIRSIKRTIRPGRRYRGAARLAGIPEDETFGDRYSSGATAAFQALANAYMANWVFVVDDMVYTPAVFSKKAFFQGPDPANPRSHTGLITLWQIRATLGTQNSRKQPGSLA
jgi:hypothetical protein